ncbi:Transmembrane and TPR repeat-containing protein [Lucilia cuprina]|uniref:dolichyl-phosphate-mannose--protein mannosyltransferase n=1 Tax=Lucilia cuprina TaxID=7375 RepID=A0A0L0BNE4_LUCCU|nr:Transmembrane and TPR repeat-containing protein [Lucilia cuprina]KNC21448.1 Transmembrane and TPR repeat-containing protein [Lucilia cuprina]
MMKFLEIINNYYNKLLNSTIGSFLLLCSLCYLCYGHALHGTFVFDDTVAIKRNKAINQLPTNLTAIFTSDFWGSSITDDESHKSYRPLTSLMFHLEWVKLKLDPFHMKLINLLIHTINTILVLLVMRKIKIFTYSYTVALLTAILFAVHPVHTEAVSGIVSRADLMFCLIYLTALLICVVMYNKTAIWLPGLVVGLTLVGVLFKESAITIPLSCVLLDYTLQRVYTLNWKQQLRKLLTKTNIFYALTTICIIALRLWIADFKSPTFRKADNPVAHADSFLTRVLSQNYLYVYNIKILLNPYHLCFDWAFDCLKLIENLTDLRVIPILLLYLCISVCLYKYQYNFVAVFGLLLIIIPFLPASGVIKVGFVIAERVLYVPSIGHCYLVSCGFMYLQEKIKYRKTLSFGFIVLVLIFILRCRQRSTQWLTEEKLFTSALAVCPNNAKVHYNIARLSADMKNNAQAFVHYHKAIELYPAYDSALMNLGNLYRETGDLRKAEIYLQKSLEVTPDLPAAWMNLGIVQAASKQFKESLISYKKALKYRKNYPNCYYNMGNLFLEQNLYTEALNHWQRAISLNPSFQKAWTNMLTMLDAKSMFEDALRLSEQALIHLPNESSILFLRANVFGKLGRYIEAEQLYKRIVAKEPLNYMYHTNLAVLYHRWNRLNEAIAAYRKALDANPQKALTARDNLGKLIKRLANKNVDKKQTASIS